ncbi:U6 snRNA-associated Sm-like protein LSm8 [Suhomyces tanzawaensis NRRL Y-17324]|uniref:LSM2-LSM8 complex subunit LSM8 n=1 Tax=Suhomyces tanzawaensis NRRL Y-17324 TaxID=984487 RepID=A0A1E4SGK3_9ASCO|nr:U6 snRNA-associated Sm-like protein LSm8 [Suhomyces tanzawaensis NRRL Y-17324]ODV78643.1 U6 snRNA-associated Sm-like protein LSm8 [Suhomyces tanzawaensis NRRL Y-17324]
MADLKEFLEKRVRVISTDARLFEGILQGFDKSTNIIISNCIERIIYDDDEENQEIALGLYMMRGGTVVCVGEIDEEAAQGVDWLSVKGELKGTKNPL